jgi:hypothetical protein
MLMKLNFVENVEDIIFNIETENLSIINNQKKQVEDTLKIKNNIFITEDVVSTDFILDISHRVILVIIFGYLIHIG